MAASRSAWIVLSLLVPAIAGCLDDDTDRESPAPETTRPAARDIPLHLVDRIEEVAVTARDEIVLRGHVYIPNGTGPFAVILNYAPYWNSLQGHSEAQQADADHGPSMAGIFGPLLEAGFAVALVNIRGTGESDGCNSWLDPAIDGADANDVIDYLAGQPWSNGNVGMVGISWHGYSQYAALYEQPEALKAVAPASAIIDAWTLWTRKGPTINSQFGPMATTYATFQAAIGIGIQGDIGDGRAECPEHAAQIQAYNQLTLDGDKSAFMQARDNTPVLARNAESDDPIAMFVTNGLTRFGEGHILQADGLWEVMPEEHRRLVLGQWPHAYPDDELRDLYPQQLVEWFDHYLRGGPKTIDSEVVLYQDDTDAWHESPVWPPASKPARLYLSGGALGVAGAGSLVADPNDVVGGSASFQTLYIDPKPDDCPGGKVLYVSPPLAEDVLMAGNYLANVTITSTHDNGNFGVHVWAVDGVDVCGTNPAAYAEYAELTFPGEVSRALSDLRHRGHLEQGSPFPIGSPDLMSMQSHPFASVAKAGQRLVVGIAAGSIEMAPRAELPLLTVTTGPGIEGWVELPVVSGELRFG